MYFKLKSLDNGDGGYGDSDDEVPVRQPRVRRINIDDVEIP